MTADLQGCVLGIFVPRLTTERPIRVLGGMLHERGAVVHYLGLGSKTVRTQEGTWVTDAQAEDISPRYYDGIVIPMGHDPSPEGSFDDDLAELIREIVESRRPIGAIGEGVLVLRDAGILKDRRVSAKGLVRDAVERSGAICENDAVIVDKLIVTASDSNATREFCDAFASEVEVIRKRDYLDETSMESFPGSDSISGAGI